MCIRDSYYGNLEDAEEIGEIVHGAGAKYVMGVNPISLGLIKTPAEYGADVAVEMCIRDTYNTVWRLTHMADTDTCNHNPASFRKKQILTS